MCRNVKIKLTYLKVRLPLRLVRSLRTIRGRFRRFPVGVVPPLRPVSTSANSVARTGTIACSSIEKKSDWLSLILVAKKLNMIQLPELTARSPVNARFRLGFRAAHALILPSLGRAAEFAEVETGL